MLNKSGAKKVLRRLLNKVLLGYDISKAKAPSHLYPNDCYYGHLSIYLFASQFIAGRRVIDAGSGLGYGSAYLAENGADFVLGLEFDNESVKFSRKNFKRPNLVYKRMDLQEIKGIEAHHFDTIFSSNVLHLIPDVNAFLGKAWGLLKPEGTLIAAVPPITSKADLSANISSVDHLHIWSPRQWHHVLGRYFSEIDCYAHCLEKPGVVLNLGNKPEESKITGRDFSFPKVGIDDLGHKQPSITAIFVARKPVLEKQLPPPGEYPVFIDNSFSRSPDSQRIRMSQTAALTDITQEREGE